MATILNEKKSDGGSPYIFYTIDASVSNRKVNSIDVSYTVTSHLQYSSSSLNTGTLTSYITLNGTEYALTLKTSSQHWSGTTRHTSSNKVTVTGLSSSQTALDNIKFRVTRESGGTSGKLGSTSCSNLTIPIGHTAPTNVSYTIEETNQKLIDAQLPETIWVKNLSQKKITLNYTLHDNATVKYYGYADTYKMYGQKSNPFVTNPSNINKDNKTNKVTVYGYIEDSLGAIGKSNSTRYDFIEYIVTSLNESTTRVNRNGQLSGRAKLNIKGSFFNGIIGTINQSGNYKPTIKYKYWKLNDQEPETFDNIISADNITISNNTFAVNDLEIGSSDETAANHFNPDYAYRVKIYVEDNFTSYTSQEKPIPVGEATWTEYKDRVDFKKITKQGLEILAQKVLYENASGSNSNITLSDNASNYEYIEIFYKNNDNAFSSVKVYQPNGKKVSLISHDNNGKNTVWVKFTLVVISGNTITFGNAVEIALVASNAITASASKLNYITRVIGYK